MGNAVPISEFAIIIRLCLGFLAGGIIGFERSSRRQIAGLRTHILICLGATLLMLLSIWLSQGFNETRNGDPGRIAAQVVSGIGFLGAGAIIRLGNNVKGLTTAASLWLIAAVGMAIGAGMYIAAAAAEALSLITLVVLDRIEKKIFPAARNKLLEIQYKPGSKADTAAAREILKNYGLKIQSMDVNQGLGKGKNTRLRFLVSIPDSADISKLARAFKTAGDAARVEIKEKF
ncbi:MAG: MgtC/SapB family protein [Treponema sp.]|jgi:putative Mg2+ transporter-C (MgtC) family protein|nr:MgtC/SapB family protein [Treponema sp.]